MVHTSSTRQAMAWPNNINLPAGQASMDHVDWIDFIEGHLVGIDQTNEIDRSLLTDARQELLSLRRSHYRAAEMACPRWPMVRMG